MTTAREPGKGLRTTAIGSLPHHNVDAAIEFSFRFDIPFLPQIPIRNPWEYMIPQALENLPGLTVEKDGSATVSLPLWERRERELGEKLDQAFRDPSRLADFEPQPSTSSLWQPFLWELAERDTPLAKIQIAGPLTSQWALKVRTEKGETPADRHPELSTQIYRLVLARALAMARRIRSQGTTPILFFDEPALFAYSAANPRHRMAFEELKLALVSLKKEGALVGIHCCSDTDWKALLGLPLDFLSLDAGLSLAGLVSQAGRELGQFVSRGGRLALGIVPTARPAVLQSLGAGELLESVRTLLEPCGPELSKKVLDEALFTPACGLAYHTVPDAELVSALLSEISSEIT